MRTNLMLIALSLALLGVCAACVGGLTTTGNELIGMVNTAQNTLAQDVDKTQEQVTLIEARWLELRKSWQLFAIHEDLHTVTETLNEAKEALENGESADAHSALKRLELAIRDILDKEIPSAGNIF